jgi:FkbM family methyltransferase
VPDNAKAGVIGGIAFGLYEYPERVLIGRWLPTDLDCVELGCSIGIVSRIILRKLKPMRRLLGVEASAELLDLARKNVSAAGFSSQFFPIHGAIHYDGPTVVFAHHPEHIRGKVTGSEQTEGVITPCVTLAQVIHSGGLEAYSLVIDIEGSEFDLVARDVESLVKCQAIVAELHGDEAAISGFVEDLEKAGFVVAENKHSVFAFVRPSDGHVRQRK